MTAAPAFIFFLSGFAALLFESLGFRQTLLSNGKMPGMAVPLNRLCRSDSLSLTH